MRNLLRLMQDGRFHSGQALGIQLGVSRSAVWKQLQQLQLDLGVTIHTVRGRGYKLESPLSLLCVDALSCAEMPAGWSVVIHDQLDSTNSESLRLISAGKVAPFVVMAERQTAGRGRRGRNWVSPFAENLYYSLAWPVQGGVRQLQGLSLVVGLALLRVLRQFGVSQAGLKWPNDVLVGESKLAGILLELVGDPADLCHVVIGVGVNVNMQSVSASIGQPWTSVKLCVRRSIDRNAFARALSYYLDEYLARYRQGGFGAFSAEWAQNDLWYGRSVVLSSTAKEVCGVVAGVDGSGALMLRVDGEMHAFSGGEISLRLGNDS